MRGLISLALLVGLLGANPVQAASAPVEYQTGKLLDIQEKRSMVTTYKPVHQSDGKNITLPVQEEKKQYDIIVQLGDKVYVARYSPAFSFKRPPGWVLGDPVQVRISKNKLVLKKPNGKELKAKIQKQYRASDYPPKAS